MFTKVRGVTFENEDGSSRQDILEELYTEACDGDAVELRREPDNEYDENAIAVYTEDERQLGFLSRELAADLAPEMDDGWEPEAAIANITQSKSGVYGCNIEIIREGDEDRAKTSHTRTKTNHEKSGPDWMLIFAGVIALILLVCVAWKVFKWIAVGILLLLL